MADSMNNLILQKLEEYGDSVIEGKSKKKKNKDKKRDTWSVDDHTTVSKSALTSNVSCSERQKKRRKKKRKEDKEDENEIKEVESDNEPHLSGHERRLREMSEQLGLAEFKLEMERKQNKKEEEETKKTNQPEVVVFTSHKSKKSKKAEEKKERMGSSHGPEFDMRQARFDVQKFGIKGFQGNQKEEAMTALLIKLGAKPPKNKYVNYKEYQDNKKQQKLEEKQKKEMDRKLGYKIPKANRGKKRTRDKNDIGPLDGQVGMWKSGVQIVKKDDLKGFKKAKLK
ncbi:uncharacterized protein C1orf131 homolog [Mercenaria mercenaria]|uniref:uncharacterized protein C1orf131 homolog n=1 Tax=Mercenaria mercenaria TaxID=6596 RepID=UPI00234EB16E|nr:uncharacterized protein C1orf131 homolog [Mercenaria mercenaria]XP_053380781.1 uncharacterized protein C1orf131 homolog [Mercenaria mercenaria]XP_053380782.1 uncharacterized protein C1orf131 homolog [Mercenaria mercenaria]